MERQASQWTSCAKSDGVANRNCLITNNNISLRYVVPV